ncbi:putative deoxyhypusine hydroxylase [Trypanosoma rangeli]|uniref:Deoxyhypusine hydroxylase n=1 Tax=Trypanosoma rangeli TaxID=5698 RepID=A0A3R7KQN3_TRYRA|nr:putative deoxyhypusine hydroxylase [Trypanosoma rangeli]RNF07814.1 putative deoxyhypusine hydroxylase [Trypanosoma rangeli]|eukprot:RNF07814.1 putative deoxyhypusine hydroxylase [Trypanosoma rangeli]
MTQDFAAYEADYKRLLDPAEPLDSRTRELYRLKQSILKTPAGVHVLAKAVDTTDSVLLQHEVVYNIGQSGLEEACPVLERVIHATDVYDTVTRHEAIESLGAIASSLSTPILERYMDPANEPEVAIRESCELALGRIRTREARGDAALKLPSNCPYVSIDPAPAFCEANTDGPVPSTVEELERLLCDTTGATSLWRRYQAMFSLRNMGTKAAVMALARALREDTASALLRHEVAFVLGQMEHPASQTALVAALKDEEEAPMVRHEAAEALGAIADPAVLDTLAEYAKHQEPIVRDSCIVAVEMHKYWSQFNAQRSAAPA